MKKKISKTRKYFNELDIIKSNIQTLVKEDKTLLNNINKLIIMYWSRYDGFNHLKDSNKVTKASRIANNAFRLRTKKITEVKAKKAGVKAKKAGVKANGRSTIANI